MGALGMAKAWDPQAGILSPPCRWKEVPSQNGIPEPWSRLRASFKMLGSGLWLGLGKDLDED